MWVMLLCSPANAAAYYLFASTPATAASGSATAASASAADAAFLPAAGLLAGPAHTRVLHLVQSSPGFWRHCTRTQNMVRYDGHTFKERGRGGYITHASPGRSSQGMLDSPLEAVEAALGAAASRDQLLRNEHSESEAHHTEMYRRLQESFQQLGVVLKSNRAAIVRLNAKLIKRPVVCMHATVPSYASLCMQCYPWACLCPQVCCHPHACWPPLLHHW